jgi:hypothetical protein
MIPVTHGDQTKRQERRIYLEDHAVGISEGIIWNMECRSPTSIIIPDIDYTNYPGLLQHLMDWVTFFRKHHLSIDKFNLFVAMLPPYPGFTGFNKQYTH